MTSKPTHTIELHPLGHVRCALDHHRDDHWGEFASVIELAQGVSSEVLLGLEAFSHLEVIYHFDQVPADGVCNDARHPRGRQDWPRVGILAQRARRRPNRLGLSRCRLVKVEGRRIHVLDLDAIDGTPVVDIKPMMVETLPREALKQPAWSTELMQNYYSQPESDEVPQ